MASFVELHLSIDTTFAGGSISLLSGGREIDFWTGKSKLSKSEDILIALDSLLKNNKVEKKHLERVFVTNGPGSFTGIRIGLAFAQGFCKYLGCSASGVSVLDAMRFMGFENNVYKNMIYVYIYNLNKVYIQFASDNDRKLTKESRNVFKNTENIESFTLEAFLSEYYQSGGYIRAFFSSEILPLVEALLEEFENKPGYNLNIECLCVQNLAKFVGIAGYNLSEHNKLIPIYL